MNIIINTDKLESLRRDFHATRDIWLGINQFHHAGGVDHVTQPALHNRCISEMARLTLAIHREERRLFQIVTGMDE